MFIKEADEIGLKVCPFDSGFFVTVPTEQAEEVAAELRKSDLFIVPLGDGANAGLRVALCAIRRKNYRNCEKNKRSFGYCQ